MMSPFIECLAAVLRDDLLASATNEHRHNDSIGRDEARRAYRPLVTFLVAVFGVVRRESPRRTAAAQGRDLPAPPPQELPREHLIRADGTVSREPSATKRTWIG
jgi:hypothetical protein